MARIRIDLTLIILCSQIITALSVTHIQIKSILLSYILTLQHSFLKVYIKSRSRWQYWLSNLVSFFEILNNQKRSAKRMSGSKQTQLLGQQRKTLNNLWTKLKHSIFDVLFVVLDRTSSEGEESTITSIVYESGVDYFQMMQFPFNATILMVWNGGQTLNNIFNFFTNVLQINNLMPSLNYNAFLVCLYLLIFLIILVIVDIVYVSYSFTKKKFSFTLPLVLLAQIVPLFVTFLFIPIVELLLNIITCNPSSNDPSITVLNYFPTIECFSGTHIIHASITLFFTSIFVFISTIVAMTLFQPRMTSQNLAARRSSQGQVIFIANKVICQFFFSFTPFEQTWVYIVLMFFPALWLFYFYHFNDPYYNRKVGKLFRIFSAYYFWTVLMLSLSQLFKLMQFQFQGAMVIWFCALPFIGFNIAYQSSFNIHNLFSSNMKFKTGEQLQAHLHYVLLLLNDRKKDENSNMLLVGYIEKHIETCVEQDCPIKMKKPKKQQVLSQMDQNCKLLIIQLQRMYKQGIKKFPQSTKLHISFAFFYMQRLHLNAKAYEQFVKAEHASPSFIEQFIIYRFKKIIKQKLEESKEEQSDLIEIIRFDNHVSLCEEAMIYSAKLHKEFWSELIEETPSLEKLNETGSKIIDIVNSVKSNYTEVNKINSHSPEIIHNYGVYSMFISQNLSQGKRCLNSSKRAYFQKKTKGDLLISKDSTLDIDSNHSMVISASSLSMGKILSVSDQFIEMSGYLKQQITQKSIDKILPQVYLFYHEQVMNKWLVDVGKVYMNNERNKYFADIHRGFIKQKNGFIVPVRYKVKYSVFQEKFYAFMNNQKEFNENLEFKIYIITDSKGIIKEISSLGFAFFNFTKESLTSADRYIDQLGLPFCSQMHDEQGIVINLTKKNGGELVANEQSLQKTLGQQRQRDVKEDSQFYVKAEKIWIATDEQEDQQNTNNLIKDGKKDIGSIICLQKINKQKLQTKEVKLQALNNFCEQILQFYEMSQQVEQQNQEAPILAASRASTLRMAVQQLIQAEQQAMKQKTFLKYGEKIKTYRLVNNELKRVVQAFGEEESEYDQFDEENVGLSAFQMQKLKNPLFVEKIKNAINTNIDHIEVGSLKIVFTLFILILCVLSSYGYSTVRRQFDSLQTYSDTNLNWVRDMHHINVLIHTTLNSSLPNETLSSNQALILDHKIAFDPPIKVKISSYDGQENEVRLQSALVWIQGFVMNFFNEESLLYNQTSLLLKNFYEGVYPALQSFNLQILQPSNATLIAMIGLIGASVLTVVIWIYVVMRVDRKCSDIILWFLDIPIPYVTHLQVNCNTFIKSYLPVRELLQKGINFHDKNLYLQQYKSSGEQDEFNEENKSRKIMIARYKKKTLLSMCNFYYLSMLWLVIYSSLLAVAYLVALQTEVTFFNFMNMQWQKTAKQLLWSSTLPNNLRLLQNGVDTVGKVNLTTFQSYLQSQFLNPISKKGLQSIQLSLIEYGTQISQYYHLVFEGDICQFQFYTDQQANQCKSYLNAKLQGGIQSVFTYYATLNPQKYVEIQHAQYDYINLYLMNVFQLWKKTFDMNVNNMIDTVTIVLVLYLSFSIFGYLLLLAIYLRSLNRKLNQTIQMLNMIPIRMLPKSRKDIRDFFSWIIKKANKSRHEST